MAIVVAEPVAELVTRAPETRNRARELWDAFFRGRNPSTVEAYRKDLVRFAEFLGLADDTEAAVKRLLSCSAGDANALALDYRASMLEQKRAPATIVRRLSSLRAFTKLARMLGMITWTIEVQNVRVKPYKDTFGPGEEGYQKMLAHVAARGDAKGTRDVAILRLLHDRGFRRGEIVALDLAHYDFTRRRVSMLGKARLEREWFSLPHATCKAIDEWLEVRGREPGPLFTALDGVHFGHRLTGSGVYLMVREVGEAVGIRARPHEIRHTAITKVGEMTNGNIVVMQQFSRHRDPKTVMLYVDNLRDQGGEIAKQLAGDEAEAPAEPKIEAEEVEDDAPEERGQTEEELMDMYHVPEAPPPADDDQAARVRASLARMGMLRK